MEKIIIEDLEECEDVVGQLDKELLNMLHMLEDLNLDAVKMVKIASNICEVRRERRYWKELTHLKQQLGKDGVKNLLSWVKCKKQRSKRYIEEARYNAERFFS